MLRLWPKTGNRVLLGWAIAAAALLLAAVMAGALPGRPAAGSAGRLLLLAGTPYETEAYVYQSSRPGPAALVLGGVHGNEQAGWMAARSMRDWRVEAGTLLVVPCVNQAAVAAGTRTLPEIGDVNRAYPGTASPDPAASGASAAAGMPAENIAREITGLMETYRVTLFIDLHEAADFHRSNPESLGQTIEFAANDRSALLSAEAADAVNAMIAEPYRKFSCPAHPVALSGAEYAGRQYGIAAFTVETSTAQPLADRMAQHCAIVRALLKANGNKEGL